jgi:hypothetical protein
LALLLPGCWIAIYVQYHYSKYQFTNVDGKMGLQKKMFVGILLASSFVLAVNLISAADKLDIVVIWGDDIGQSNVSAYSMGLMGY